MGFCDVFHFRKRSSRRSGSRRQSIGGEYADGIIRGPDNTRGRRPASRRTSRKRTEPSLYPALQCCRGAARFQFCRGVACRRLSYYDDVGRRRQAAPLRTDPCVRADFKNAAGRTCHVIRDISPDARRELAHCALRATEQTPPAVCHVIRDKLPSANQRGAWVQVLAVLDTGARV